MTWVLFILFLCHLRKNNKAVSISMVKNVLKLCNIPTVTKQCTSLHQASVLVSNEMWMETGRNILYSLVGIISFFLCFILFILSNVIGFLTVT